MCGRVRVRVRVCVCVCLTPPNLPQTILDVKKQLSQLHVTPVRADDLHMESGLEQAFNLALQAKCTQSEYLSRAQREKEEEEKGFHDKVRAHEQQQLAALAARKGKRMGRRGKGEGSVAGSVGE